MLKGINSDYEKKIIEIVCFAQNYIRQNEQNYSVSLRDVNRFKKIFDALHKMNLEKRKYPINKKITINSLVSKNIADPSKGELAFLIEESIRHKLRSHRCLHVTCYSRPIRPCRW